MADTHKQFTDFHDTITLNDSRKESLRKSRKAIRDRVISYMKKEKPNEALPNFWGQGSFAMGTTVNPIPDGEKLPYDLDDGVYWKVNLDERKSPSTYHSWLCEALNNHTDEEPKDKNTCVRVLFSDGHHIDLPIYFMDKSQLNPIPMLGHKEKGWVVSDPKAFVAWFKEKRNDQSMRMVRYFKAWLDNKSQSGKMPSGFMLTIYIINHYVANDRDDLCFYNLADSILRSLNIQGFWLKRPTQDVSENLFDKFTEPQRLRFKTELEKLVKDGKNAIDSKVPRSACEYWQKHFGNRFACSTASEDMENAKQYSSPAIIKEPAKSA
jgi:hypothetical protein